MTNKNWNVYLKLWYFFLNSQFRAARKVSEEVGAQIVLGDRPIEITVWTFWLLSLIFVVEFSNLVLHWHSFSRSSWPLLSRGGYQLVCNVWNKFKNCLLLSIFSVLAAWKGLEFSEMAWEDYFSDLTCSWNYIIIWYIWGQFQGFSLKFWLVNNCLFREQETEW